MKKICFIAQFPPPMHGLSKAVETLYLSEELGEFELEKIDITDNKKILLNLNKIKKSSAELYYFTISQSKSGNIRDLLILKEIRKKKAKCIIHLHGGYYGKLFSEKLKGWQKKANIKAFKHIDGAIVLSPTLRKNFYGLIDESKIFIASNGVDNKYLMSDEDFDNKKSNIDFSHIKHVLYLSNFIKSKGYPMVLQMAQNEKNRVESGGKRKFHFDFAGAFFDKKDEHDFFSYIRENDLDQYITYHGIVDGHKKRILLEKSEFFVLLTKYPKEGQPISILEAMGNGMVIVTTDHAGIPDIVKSNENGVVMTQNMTIEDVYREMMEFNDDKIKNTISINREKVKNKYTEKQYVLECKKIFKKVMEV